MEQPNPDLPPAYLRIVVKTVNRKNALARKAAIHRSISRKLAPQRATIVIDSLKNRRILGAILRSHARLGGNLSSTEKVLRIRRMGE